MRNRRESVRWQSAMSTPFRTPGAPPPLSCSARTTPVYTSCRAAREPRRHTPLRRAGNDAFAGGQRVNVAPPPAIGGGLFTPPGGGPTQPTQAVNPGGLNFARNNKGSNITIPHARVVPVSSVESALPSAPDGKPTSNNPSDTFALGPDGKRRPFGGVVESDGLDAGRIGFVLGPRSERSTVAGNTMDIENVPLTQNRTGLWQKPQRMAGSGVDRTDRMCSLECASRIKPAARLPCGMACSPPRTCLAGTCRGTCPSPRVAV